MRHVFAVARQGLLAAVLVLAGCAGNPDGRVPHDDMAGYAYSNEPVLLGDEMLKPGRDGAAIASSDIAWRVPAECRRDYRGWLSTLPAGANPIGRQDDWLALGRCTAPAKDAFVGVAITGGGNKSAVYSAEVLFELERYRLAGHIDVLSSVSGGSFTAALYSVSCDKRDKLATGCPNPAGEWKRPLWDYRSISQRMETNYLLPFLGTRLLLNHLFLNATTHHGSADDMVDVVAGRLLQERGRKLVFADLNPQRPNLILNATNTASDRAALDQDAGIPAEAKRPLSDDDALHFSFTQQYFWRLMSRLDSYPLADAVVASAAFPLLIDRPSLRVYRPEDLQFFARGGKYRKPQYVSLYDGGVHDNFGLTELRWFVECQFGRNARRTVWTPTIRERNCGSKVLPTRPPAATLIIGINSSLLRTAGVSPDKPKPRTWDSYLGPLRVGGAAASVDMIMAASGELRKMELRSLVEEISRARAKAPPAVDGNPFVAGGPDQYVDIDIEAAFYMSCRGPVGRDGSYHGRPGDEIILNSASGGTEQSRCAALQGVLKWNAERGLALPEAAAGFCSRDDCPELDRIVGDRTLGTGVVPEKRRMFIGDDAMSAPRLLNNQLLFEAAREVPTNFELSAHYVRLLRYLARWSVAHRVWELCNGHADLLEKLPGGAGPVCRDPLPVREGADNPGSS